MVTDNEHRAIDEVVDRIAERFPNVPPEDVRDAVHRHLASYEGAAVRDFVPVLVEREVVAELDAR